MRALLAQLDARSPGEPAANAARAAAVVAAHPERRAGRASRSCSCPATTSSAPVMRRVDARRPGAARRCGRPRGRPETARRSSASPSGGDAAVANALACIDARRRRSPPSTARLYLFGAEADVFERRRPSCVVAELGGRARRAADLLRHGVPRAGARAGRGRRRAARHRRREHGALLRRPADRARRRARSTTASPTSTSTAAASEGGLEFVGGTRALVGADGSVVADGAGGRGEAD